MFDAAPASGAVRKALLGRLLKMSDYIMVDYCIFEYIIYSLILYYMLL